jgi:hypothetical protein
MPVTEEYSPVVLDELAHVEFTDTVWIPDRRGPEYAGSYAAPVYGVTSVRLSLLVSFDGRVLARTSVEVSSESIDGIVQAAKDLFDRRVSIRLRDSTLDEWFLSQLPDAAAITADVRAAVIYLDEDLAPADWPDLDDEGRNSILQLLFKDWDVDYGASGVDVSLPSDINGPAGQSVIVWDTMAVCWGFVPKLMGTFETVCEYMAFACTRRAVLDDLLGRTGRLLVRLSTAAVEDNSGSLDDEQTEAAELQAVYLQHVALPQQFVVLRAPRPMASFYRSASAQIGLSDAIASAEESLRQADRVLERVRSIVRLREAEHLTAQTVRLRRVVLALTSLTVALAFASLLTSSAAVPQEEADWWIDGPQLVAAGVLVLLLGGLIGVAIDVVSSIGRRGGRTTTSWVAVSVVSAFAAVSGVWAFTRSSGGAAVVLVLSTTAFVILVAFAGRYGSAGASRS